MKTIDILLHQRVFLTKEVCMCVCVFCIY